MYNMKGYSFVHKPRKQRRGGGVCLYVDRKFNFSVRDDLSFSNEYVDTLFIEIEMESEKNIIFGVVYKAPNSDAHTFNGMLEHCVESIAKESKLCYIVGDFNFDILKYSTNASTNDFLSIYVHTWSVPASYQTYPGNIFIIYMYW